MSSPSEKPVSSQQPKIAELLAQYLAQQASAHQAGLAYRNTAGDVVPHEAVVAQPIDPRVAWEGACTAIGYLVPQQDLHRWSPPTEWPALVGDQESITFLPMCLGSFPQQVRELSGLMAALPLTQPARPSHSSGASPALLAWADSASWQKGKVNPLLAAAALRLAGEYDRSRELLEGHQKDLPKAWEAAWANEAAALAWHQGQRDEAERMWRQQPESVPVLFNRGLAALTAGRNREARKFLSQAVAQLPETDSWHHLGQLYLALAEIAA